MPRGFTILELLVVVAVVGVLLAILLPALEGARRSAALNTRLATAQSLGTTIASYSHDYTGAFPYLMTPRQPELGMTDIRGWRCVYPTSYFVASSKYWSSIVFPEMVDAPRELVFSECEFGDWKPVDAATVQRPCSVSRSLLFMTGTTAAAPEFWQGGSFYPSETLCVGMRFADVRFPSAKGLLLDVSEQSIGSSDEDPSSVWAHPLIALMDGSAGYKPLPGDTWTRRIMERGWGSMPWPIMSTPDGLRGRDF